MIKDLSFMIFYFVLMKYNLTSETALERTLNNHPGISDWSLLSIVQGSLFYNLTTMFVSLILYFPIVYLVRNLIPNRPKVRLILTGFVLTATTPIYYLFLNEWRQNPYYLPKAERFAWVLCFVISIAFYFLINNKKIEIGPRLKNRM